MSHTPFTERPTHWKCRDGRVVPIIEMATQHIENAIAMLRRKGWVTPEEFVASYVLPPPQGEMAQMAWEGELGAMRFSFSLAALEAELEVRRRLDARTAVVAAAP